MDIMRHGGNVEVFAPRELRDQIRSELEQALARYDARP